MSFLVAAEVQPFRVTNPVRAEAYRVLFAIPSVEVALSELILRVGVGVGLYSYSGADVFVDEDAGFAWGLAAGWRPTSRGDGKWIIEAGAMAGSSSDGELRAYNYAVRLMRMFGGRRPS
jgi:hypothetical protein